MKFIKEETVYILLTCAFHSEYCATTWSRSQHTTDPVQIMCSIKLAHRKDIFLKTTRTAFVSGACCRRDRCTKWITRNYYDRKCRKHRAATDEAYTKHGIKCTVTHTSEHQLCVDVCRSHQYRRLWHSISVESSIGCGNWNSITVS